MAKMKVAPLSVRKSPRFENTVKKKPEKSEKQTGSTPLRRSEKGNVPASNVKSTKKSGDISKENAEDFDQENEDGGSKKRKRYTAVKFKARYKPQRVRIETDSEGSEDLARTESPSSSGDQFWCAAVGNGTPVANETVDGNADSLYEHLNPTVSELCDIFKFSEGAKIIVERFLKFVVGNFNVSKEHTNILQALMISVCWICSSLLKHTIDRKESFDLAKKHLNFICEEEEADEVYEKLEKPKEMFLQIPKNLKMLNAFKDCGPRDQEPEKHGSSNEEALQSSGQILEEDLARKERNEIGKKKMNIVSELELEKTLIRYLHNSNPSVRSGKLNLVEKEFADELNKHERSRQVSFIDLKAKLKADVGQVVVNDEAESHDKPVRDMCPDGVSSEGIGDNSAKQDADVENGVAGPDVTALGKPVLEIPDIEESASEQQDEDLNVVSSEPIGDISAKRDSGIENDVSGAVSSETIEDIPDIEEIASEQDDEVVNVVSIALTEPVGDIPAKQNGDTENDVPGQDESLELEVPEIDSNKENATGESTEPVGSSEMNMPAVINVDFADGSYAIQDPPNETGMPIDIDMAHGVEDPNKNGSNDISLHVDTDQMEIPAANDPIEYANGSHVVENQNKSDPHHMPPNVEFADTEIQAQDTTPSLPLPASSVSHHLMPPILGIHSDSQLPKQPSENGIRDQEGQADPTPMLLIEDDNTQPVEAIQGDEIIQEDSSLSPHDEPSSVMSTNPTITENQSASLLEQYMINLQRNANSNQAGSRNTRRVDPLRVELEQLTSVKEKMDKSYHDNILKMNIDCETEIAEAISAIRLKYCNKRQEADASFNSQKKEVENSMNTVVINQVLAAAFRRKCQDVSRGCAAVLQACQAEQQRSFRGPSTCLQPPLQIVNQPSALFSTPLTNLRPANTTPIRPPPPSQLPRGLNILKTPEFPGGGNAAQPPTASTEVVYLSDED